MENLEKCTQEYLEHLLSEMSETATLEDLIRRIGEKQRERILKGAQAEAERLQKIVDRHVKDRVASAGGS